MGKALTPLLFNVIYKRFPSNDPDAKLSLKFTEYLITLLEDKDNNRLGYYAERDARPGQSIFSETFRAIRASRFTIVVLSRKFVEECGTCYWLHAAFHQSILSETGQEPSNVLIPIALGITRETVLQFCQHLCVHEILNVPLNYEVEQLWQDKLLMAMMSEKNFPQVCDSKAENASLACVPPHPSSCINTSCSAQQDEPKRTPPSTAQRATLGNLPAIAAHPSTLRGPIATDTLLFYSRNDQQQTVAPDSTGINKSIASNDEPGRQLFIASTTTLETDDAMCSGTGPHQAIIPCIDICSAYPPECAVTSGQISQGAKAASELCQVGEDDHPDDSTDAYSQNDHQASSSKGEYNMDSLLSFPAFVAGPEELEHPSQSEFVAANDEPVNRDQVDQSPLVIAADDEPIYTIDTNVVGYDLPEDAIGVIEQCLLDSVDPANVSTPSANTHERPNFDDLLLLNVDGAVDHFSLDCDHRSIRDDMQQQCTGGAVDLLPFEGHENMLLDVDGALNYFSLDNHANQSISDDLEQEIKSGALEHNSHEGHDTSINDDLLPLNMDGAVEHFSLQSHDDRSITDDLLQEVKSGALDHLSLEGHDDTSINDGILPLKVDDAVDHSSLDNHANQSVCDDLLQEIKSGALDHGSQNDDLLPLEVGGAVDNFSLENNAKQSLFDDLQQDNKGSCLEQDSKEGNNYPTTSDAMQLENCVHNSSPSSSSSESDDNTPISDLGLHENPNTVSECTTVTVRISSWWYKLFTKIKDIGIAIRQVFRFARNSN